MQVRLLPTALGMLPVIKRRGQRAVAAATVQFRSNKQIEYLIKRSTPGLLVERAVWLGIVLVHPLLRAPESPGTASRSLFMRSQTYPATAPPRSANRPRTPPRPDVASGTRAPARLRLPPSRRVATSGRFASRAAGRNQQTARHSSPMCAGGRRSSNQRISSSNHRRVPSANRPDSASRSLAWISPVAVRTSGRHSSDGTVKRMYMVAMPVVRLKRAVVDPLPAPFPRPSPRGAGRGRKRKRETGAPALPCGRNGRPLNAWSAHACAPLALVVAKSAMTAGVAVSKPTTSSMPASFGSAIVNPFDVMAITTSFAPIPIFWR